MGGWLSVSAAAAPNPDSLHRVAPSFVGLGWVLGSAPYHRGSHNQRCADDGCYDVPDSAVVGANFFHLKPRGIGVERLGRSTFFHGSGDGSGERLDEAGPFVVDMCRGFCDCVVGVGVVGAH